MRSVRRSRNFRRIGRRDCRVGWDCLKDLYAFRAVVGSLDTSEGVADVRVRMDLLVEGEIVVIVSEEEDVLLVVSPLVGCVEVLSCVILCSYNRTTLECNGVVLVTLVVESRNDFVQAVALMSEACEAGISYLFSFI